MSGITSRGSRAVVTGAASGIGHATVLRLAGMGFEVVCVDIDEAGARDTADEVGDGAVALACDVSDAAAVDVLARTVEQDLGPVDLVVNNAGVGMGGPFLDAGSDDWDWLMGVNLDGVANGCRAFGRAMVARGEGHVVNVASGAAYVMNRDMAAYCASKAAVYALSRCLRADWAGRGVGVSVVCPGVIDTPIVSRTRLFGPLAGRQAEIGRRFRLGHAPDAVAKAIVRAAKHNDAVVPVGIESGLAHRVLPFVPGPVKELIERAPIGHVL